MSVTIKELVSCKLAEAVQTSQYTPASNVTAIIDKFTVTNNSSGDLAFSVNLVTAGANASSSNIVVKNKFISGNKTYTFPELVGQVLATGTALSTLSSVAGAAVLRVCGREVT